MIKENSLQCINYQIVKYNFILHGKKERIEVRSKGKVSFFLFLAGEEEEEKKDENKEKEDIGLSVSLQQ